MRQDSLPAGFYVHVPFCVKKCAYCDFVSFPNREGDILRYLNALVAEMDLRAPLPRIDTVFFGGGTPSLPPPDFVPAVLEALRARTEIEPGAEITCEANPGTLTAEHVLAWKRAGVNRLSIGAQAAQESLLETLGRLHRWKDVEEAAALWGDARSLSLDLMYGLPGQTQGEWEGTLAAAVALRPGHLSCYSLIVEESTPLSHSIETGTLGLPDEDAERAMYGAAVEKLAVAGYRHYEVSNWARGSRVCLHNLHTWQRREYVGIGCAAASFVAGMRTVNLQELDRYMLCVEHGELPLTDRVLLSREDALYEELMLGLRLTEGVELSREAWERYGAKLRTVRGLVEVSGRAVRLTSRGMDVMNAVLVELMELR